jgi:hypothetical protein
MGHLAIGWKGDRPLKNLSVNLRNPNPQRKQGMLWKGTVSGGSSLNGSLGHRL